LPFRQLADRGGVVFASPDGEQKKRLRSGQASASAASPIDFV